GGEAAVHESKAAAATKRRMAVSSMAKYHHRPAVPTGHRWRGEFAPTLIQSLTKRAYACPSAGSGRHERMKLERFEAADATALDIIPQSCGEVTIGCSDVTG